MANPYLGQIISVAFTFVPLGWFSCDGTKLPISQYSALFQLLGTQYGGDGINDFALPNLNGRVPLGVGQGPSLSPYIQGEAMGAESVSLVSSNTPPHTHTINFSAAAATAASPKPASGPPLAMGADVGSSKLQGFYAKKPGTVALRAGTIQPFVGGQPHENRQQFLVLNYIICWSGIYPTQG